MIDPRQFRNLVIRPALEKTGLYSDAAASLLLGTAITESGLEYLKQIGGGPALGVYQIEPATHADIWANFLNYKAGLAGRVIKIMVRDVGMDHHQLVWNLAYATVMARLIYYRRPEPLPTSGDLAGMAALWKLVYNSPKGAGKVEDFITRAGPYLNDDTKGRKT